MPRPDRLCYPWVAALPFWLIPAVVITAVATPVLPVGFMSVARAVLWLSVASLAAYALLRLTVVGCGRLFAAQAGLGLLFSVATVVTTSMPAKAFLVGGVVLSVFLARGSSRYVIHVASAARAMALVLTGVELAIVVHSLFPPPLSSEVVRAMSQVRSLPEALDTGGDPPDIYQILLDSFGQPEYLNARWGVDVGPIASELADRGFEVVPDARSNYDVTSQSLPSMLNMTYLDPLVPVMDGSRSLVPLHRLVSDSATVAALRREGYRIVVFGANYSATQDLADIDECHCAPTAFGEFEMNVLAMTPLRHVGLGGLEYSPHRRRILETFDALDRFSLARQPVFVLAHVLAPHPPFVLDRNGQAVTPAFPFSLGSGTAYRGTLADFKTRYADQARYVAMRAIAAADHLISVSRAAGRRAVVIIHGDHNTRFDADPTRPTASDGRDVLPILLAIRWPAGGRAAEPVHSLVNVYREIFGRYFGAEMFHLPDRGYVVSFDGAYKFIAVPPSKDATAR